ncbi:hypothetical protein OPV22_031975 [Ensete ventricosum]|uniref:Uncharacterized protein n=1 Tax=Ensete ventricosum TaxID=4639 RepID=A0AAV8PQH8_ENSVE|nr:hypothetical protein OPV22_031975 [Ensete ventricosum]
MDGGQEESVSKRADKRWRHHSHPIPSNLCWTTCSRGGSRRIENAAAVAKEEEAKVGLSTSDHSLVVKIEAKSNGNAAMRSASSEGSVRKGERWKGEALLLGDGTLQATIGDFDDEGDLALGELSTEKEMVDVAT